MFIRGAWTSASTWSTREVGSIFSLKVETEITYEFVPNSSSADLLEGVYSSARSMPYWRMCTYSSAHSMSY